MGTVAKVIPQPVIPKVAPREDLNPFRIAQIQLTSPFASQYTARLFDFN